MCDESLDKLVSVAHVRQDHGEIILRRPQQVWAKHNGQCLSCHLIVLFEVGDPENNSINKNVVIASTKAVPVKMLRDPFEQIKVCLG